MVVCGNVDVSFAVLVYARNVAVYHIRTEIRYLIRFGIIQNYAV